MTPFGPRRELPCGCVFDGIACVVQCAQCERATSSAGFTKADRIHLRDEHFQTNRVFFGTLPLDLDNPTGF